MNFILNQRVYIERGQYCRRHGIVRGFPEMFKDFVYVQIFDERGEITKLIDVVPKSHIRPVVEHS